MFPGRLQGSEVRARLSETVKRQHRVRSRSPDPVGQANVVVFESTQGRGHGGMQRVVQTPLLRRWVLRVCCSFPPRR